MVLKAKVHIDTVKENIAKLRTHLGKGVKVCAVIKNNGNRLGDAELAKRLEDSVEYLAGAHISEVIRMHEAGVKKPILLVGPCPDFDACLSRGIEISVNNIIETRKLVDLLKSKNYQAKVHIKINTGLNRYGIQELSELEEILAHVKDTGIEIVGVYTHGGSEEKSDLDKQIARFKPFVARVKEIYPTAIAHAAASGAKAGMILHTDMHFDMVRVGRILYGATEGYKTAVTITSKIMDLQNVKKDEPIGYGGSELANKDMTIGLVVGGYGDTIPIQFSRVVHVMVDKKPCKIMGYVNTDSFMIDVSNITDPLYKEVTIISPDAGCTWLDRVETSGISSAVIIAVMNYHRAVIEYA